MQWLGTFQGRKGLKGDIRKDFHGNSAANWFSPTESLGSSAYILIDFQFLNPM